MEFQPLIPQKLQPKCRQVIWFVFIFCHLVKSTAFLISSQGMQSISIYAFLIVNMTSWIFISNVCVVVTCVTCEGESLQQILMIVSTSTRKHNIHHDFWLLAFWQSCFFSFVVCSFLLGFVFTFLDRQNLFEWQIWKLWLSHSLNNHKMSQELWIAWSFWRARHEGSLIKRTHNWY